jgi:hypothetical protein
MFCNGFQVFSDVFCKCFRVCFASVFDACFKYFIYFQTYVASVAFKCFKSRSVLYMLQCNPLAIAPCCCRGTAVGHRAGVWGRQTPPQRASASGVRRARQAHSCLLRHYGVTSALLLREWDGARFCYVGMGQGAMDALKWSSIWTPPAAGLLGASLSFLFKPGLVETWTFRDGT